jgi:putative sterol carrier protein
MSELTPKVFMEKILPTLFIPENAKGWNRVIQFSIKDAGDWIVEIRDQKITIQEGKHPKPHLEIKTDFNTLYGIFTGEIFPPTAIMQGKMIATGSMSDHLKFSRIFKRLGKK